MFTLRQIRNHVAGIHALMGGSGSTTSTTGAGETTVTAGGGSDSTSFVTVNMSVSSDLSPEEVSRRLRDAIETEL